MSYINSTLIELDEWNQLGISTTFDVVNQLKNGSFEQGDKLYTYTFYITPFDKDYIWNYSVDSLHEGFQLAIDWLNENKFVVIKEYLSELKSDYDFLIKNGEIEVHSYESEHLIKSYIKLIDEIDVEVDYAFDSCVITKI